MTSTVRALAITAEYTYSDGNHTFETPLIPGDTLSDTLFALSKSFTDGEGVVLLDQEVADFFGFPAKAPRGKSAKSHVALDDPRNKKWKVSEVAPWMTFWYPGRPSVHVGILPWLNRRTFPMMADSMLDMTYRLRRYHLLTGGAYRMTPGVAGLSTIRGNSKAPNTAFLPPIDIEPYTQDIEGPDVNWCQVCRHPEEFTGKYWHAYDVRAQYLGAAISTDAPTGPLEHTGADFTDFSRAGYWQIEVPNWIHGRLPNPCGVRSVMGQQIWVTTPTMQLLYELDDSGLMINAVVLDSHTTAKTSRAFRAWGEKIRDSLFYYNWDNEPVDHRDILRKEIKATYNQSIGLMNSPGGRVYNPLWYHTITAKARANLNRKVYKAAGILGLEPVKNPQFPAYINHDCVWFNNDISDGAKNPPGHFSVANRLGGFRHTEGESPCGELKS